MDSEKAPLTICCVMAKAPVAGAVKTRLCPPLSPVQAADVARAFLLDTWSAASSVFGSRTVLSFAGDRAAFPSELASATAVAQSGSDLGARIESALAYGLEQADRVIVIGSDLPCLPQAALREAERALESADVCLGPSADGGYYLIGARRWQMGLLADLPWSTAVTREATEARLAERGYAAAMVAAFDDIDEPAELEGLRETLARDPRLAPHTAATLLAITT